MMLYLCLVIFSGALSGNFAEEIFDKIVYKKVGKWPPQCNVGRRMTFDQSTIDQVRVRTTTRIKFGVRSYKVFSWGITFKRAHFVRRNRNRKANLLRMDIRNASSSTIIRWVDFQATGVKEIKLKISEDGRRWTEVGTAVSENLKHRSEGPLFDLTSLNPPKECDWNKYNCRGIKGRHLKLYFTNKPTSLETPSIVDFRIGACFPDKGPAPLECRQDSWGTEYVGHKNVTQSSKSCVPWTKVMYKNDKPYYKYFKVMFTDGPASSGLAGNYCRHVGHRSSPGCHTNTNYKSWKPCHIIRC